MLFIVHERKRKKGGIVITAWYGKSEGNDVVCVGRRSSRKIRRSIGETERIRKGKDEKRIVMIIGCGEIDAGTAFEGGEENGG